MFVYKKTKQTCRFRNFVSCIKLLTLPLASHNIDIYMYVSIYITQSLILNIDIMKKILKTSQMM